MTVTWNDLFISGSLIDVDIHIWRARMKLKAKDLGIDDSPEVKKALSLGCHRLAPAEAFDKINDYARTAQKAVDVHSLPFSLIPGVRYVPDDQFQTLMTKLEYCRRKFDEAVNEFIADYETIKGDMMPVIKQALYDAAQSDDAAEKGYSRVSAEYPNPNAVRLKFDIKWSVFTIASPSSQAAAEAAGDGAKQIKGVIGDMIKSLRDEMSSKVGTLIDFAKKGKKLPTKSVNSAMRLLDRVDKMNVMKDRALTDQARVLRLLLQSSLDDETDGKESISRVMSDLSTIKSQIEGDIESAIVAAEENLVALGKRKISI